MTLPLFVDAEEGVFGKRFPGCFQCGAGAEASLATSGEVGGDPFSVEGLRPAR